MPRGNKSTWRDQSRGKQATNFFDQGVHNEVDMPSVAILKERGVVGVFRASGLPGVLLSRMPCGVALAIGAPAEDLAVGFLRDWKTSSGRRRLSLERRTQYY